MFMRYMRVLGMGAVAAMGMFTFMGSLHAGTEVATVAPGDTAGVHFTCRLPNGDVTLSTHQAMATDASVKRSNVFLARDRDTPLEITAGVIPENLQDPGKRGFESEVIYQMHRSVVGLPVGQRQKTEVRAQYLQERRQGEYLLKMARVRTRPKETRYSPEEYKARNREKAPEVDQRFVIDPAVPGRVVSVTDKEVVVKFSATPGATVTTPFGKGTVRELDDRYEIAIDAIPGTLVRSGGLVGRITAVDDRYITIDYGHPFGGEVLACDVLVEWVKPAKQENASQTLKR